MKLNNKLFHYFLVLLFLFALTTPVYAQAPILENTNTANFNNCNQCKEPYDSACKQYCGNYELNDFVKVLVKVSEWILAVTGSLALLAFVFGGIMFLISAGSSERVTKAKQIIIGAVIGLAIVFLSYMIIGFVFKALNVNVGDTPWSTTGWF